MSEIYVGKHENNAITKREESSKKFFGTYNKVFVSGVIENEFEYSHSFSWENFYRTKIKVRRNSGVDDFIPMIVSEILIKSFLDEPVKGKWIEVVGQFRSYNTEGEDGKKHLDLYLYATAVNIVETEEELEETANYDLIYLEGYICKEPIFRETPRGRKITDILIAVNREFGKSDYIPCIAWGKMAQWSKELKVGDRIKLYGRIQSREYIKRYSPDSEEGETKEAYEVSVMRIQRG